MKKLFRHWLGIDKLETHIFELLSATEIVVNFRDKNLFDGQLEKMDIVKGHSKDSFSDTFECIIKFRAKEIKEINSI